MSVKTMSKVWERLNVSGGELLLALSIADFSNDRGESIFPSVDLLCRTTRQSRATVQRQLAHFRELEWLQVVEEGGLTGGRGHTTVYRINPEWMAGGRLPKLPDILQEPTEKGLNMRPFPPAAEAAKGPHSPEAVSPDKGPHPAQQRASSDDGKGLTAMRPNPSGSTNKPLSDDPRASPSGSRVAQERELERQNYDIAARINHWRRRAGEWTVRECSILELAEGRPTQWAQLPEHVRKEIAPKLERYVTETAELERDDPHLKLDEVESRMQRRITAALKELAPAWAAGL
jgi:hypothetical protein